jgi:hypothetical protein
VTSGTGIMNCDVNCQSCVANSNGAIYCISSLTGRAIKANQNIVLCNPACASCSLFNVSMCTACLPAYALVQGSCLPCQDTNCINCYNNPAVCNACLAGFTSHQSACTPCAANCLSCLENGPGNCD